MSDEPRYPRETFLRSGYEQPREMVTRADASIPMTAAELYELERLVVKYPDYARRFVAQLPPPRSAPP